MVAGRGADELLFQSDRVRRTPAHGPGNEISSAAAIFSELSVVIGAIQRLPQVISNARSPPRSLRHCAP